LLDDLVDDGVTLVVSTPDADLVPAVADRVILMDRAGEVAADGPTREVLTDVDALRRVGLSVPTVVDLFDRLGVDDPPITVAEALEELDDR